MEFDDLEEYKKTLLESIFDNINSIECRWIIPEYIDKINWRQYFTSAQQKHIKSLIINKLIENDRSAYMYPSLVRYLSILFKWPDELTDLTKEKLNKLAKGIVRKRVNIDAQVQLLNMIKGQDCIDDDFYIKVTSKKFLKRVV